MGIKMASPVNVSPLIKTARWAFLGMGMLYGYKHKDTVAQWRKEERAVEKQMKEKYPSTRKKLKLQPTSSSRRRPCCTDSVRRTQESSWTVKWSVRRKQPSCRQQKHQQLLQSANKYLICKSCNIFCYI